MLAVVEKAIRLVDSLFGSVEKADWSDEEHPRDQLGRFAAIVGGQMKQVEREIRQADKFREAGDKGQEQIHQFRADELSSALSGRLSKLTRQAKAAGHLDEAKRLVDFNTRIGVALSQIRGGQYSEGRHSAIRVQERAEEVSVAEPPKEEKPPKAGKEMEVARRRVDGSVADAIRAAQELRSFGEDPEGAKERASKALRVASKRMAEAGRIAGNESRYKELARASREFERMSVEIKRTGVIPDADFERLVDLGTRANRAAASEAVRAVAGKPIKPSKEDVKGIPESELKRLATSVGVGLKMGPLGFGSQMTGLEGGRDKTGKIKDYTIHLSSRELRGKGDENNRKLEHAVLTAGKQHIQRQVPKGYMVTGLRGNKGEFGFRIHVPEKKRAAMKPEAAPVAQKALDLVDVVFKDWAEELHPRGERGKFAPKGEGKTGEPPKSELSEPRAVAGLIGAKNTRAHTYGTAASNSLESARAKINTPEGRDALNRVNDRLMGFAQAINSLEGKVGEALGEEKTKAARVKMGEAREHAKRSADTTISHEEELGYLEQSFASMRAAHELIDGVISDSDLPKDLVVLEGAMEKQKKDSLESKIDDLEAHLGEIRRETLNGKTPESLAEVESLLMALDRQAIGVLDLMEQHFGIVLPETRRKLKAALDRADELNEMLAEGKESEVRSAIADMEQEAEGALAAMRRLAIRAKALGVVHGVMKEAAEQGIVEK